MICRIIRYEVEFTYVKGKDILIADALSRSQTTDQNQSKIDQEIEMTRLVHEDKIKTYNKPLSGNFRSKCAGYVLTYSLQSINRFAGHYANETFLLKFYRIGALNMNCHLAMESYTGMIAY